MSDIDLAWASQSKQKALEVLCNRYLPMVQRYCATILWKNPETARDASQETMLKFIQKVRAGRVKKNVKAYILTIARNTCISMIRRETTVRDNEDGVKAYMEGKADSYHDHDKRDHRQAVRACVDELPPRLKEIVWLHKGEGLPLEEVGEQVGLEKSQTGVLSREGAAKLRILARERGLK